MLVADLHCHTIHSPDSCNHYNWIVKRCLKVGINCLAVTDHNSIDGAFILKDIAPFRIITGEEVDTGEGEVIGLFLEKWIAPGRGLERTINEIKGQGGLVYLPHPLSIGRVASLNIDLVKELCHKIDIVEVFNSRTMRESIEHSWLDEWLKHGEVVKGAGSDAHSTNEFGNVLIEMDDFQSKDQFLCSLSRGRFHVKRTSPVLRLFMNHKIRKIIRLFTYNSAHRSVLS